MEETTLINTLRQLFGIIYYRDSRPMSDRKVLLVLPEELYELFNKEQKQELRGCRLVAHTSDLSESSVVFDKLGYSGPFGTLDVSLGQTFKIEVIS